jgi:cellulose synthase/poly-beta-1,6-N-acetylglucosamine synthase-like glycosyltransferase
MIIFKLIFWICLFFIFYGYFGYSFLIRFLAQLNPKDINKKEFEPNVTLLIPVYNEERIIREKVQNSLNLDYPKNKLEIVVLSDGSTDNTCQIVKEYFSFDVKLMEYSLHQGKTSLLNKSVPKTKGEIIIFSDASGMLNDRAIKEIVANFSDIKIGCVCGLYRMVPEEESLASKGYKTYLEYDIKMKKSESRFSTILGAHGALYAIRRELFEQIPEHIINDDFYIPMMIVAKGYRAIYEDKAIALDKVRYTLKDEFRRRLRIGIGNWQQTLEFKNILKPSMWLLAWQLFSHKILRNIMPFFLITAFILSFVLQGIIYKIFFYAFILLILLALIGGIFTKLKITSELLYTPFFFVIGNIAYLVGTVKFLFKRQRIRW